MSEEFRDYTNHIADEIISLSQLLDEEVETWSDAIARVPDSTSKNVSTGFVSKPNTKSNIELVIDIQAPPQERTSRLRIWAIDIIKDDKGNERFNNIQLTYHLDYAKARQFVEQSVPLTRDNFISLAHDPANQLENVVISDLTGKDAISGQQLGKRYDLESNDLNTITEDFSNELKQLMNDVMERLKKSAYNINLPNKLH